MEKNVQLGTWGTTPPLPPPPHPPTPETIFGIVTLIFGREGGDLGSALRQITRPINEECTVDRPNESSGDGP